MGNSQPRSSPVNNKGLHLHARSFALFRRAAQLGACVARPRAQAAPQLQSLGRELLDLSGGRSRHRLPSCRYGRVLCHRFEIVQNSLRGRRHTRRLTNEVFSALGPSFQARDLRDGLKGHPFCARRHGTQARSVEGPVSVWK